MYTIDLINSIRKQFTDLVSNARLDQLNTIPNGFNNNIAWNFGHMIASGYGLAFVSTGVNASLDIPLLSKFKKGTKPEAPVTQEEINTLKDLADQFPLALEEAIKADRFQNIKSYTTQTFGLPMDTLESVLITIVAHDTLHFQTARMYNRILNS